MRPEAIVETKVKNELVTEEKKNDEPKEVIKIVEILSKNKKTTEELLQELADPNFSKTKLGKLLDQLTQSNRIKREGKYFSV